MNSCQVRASQKESEDMYYSESASVFSRLRNPQGWVTDYFRV
jgi:hypothetical protein